MDLAQLLQRRTAFNQRTAPRGSRQPGRNGRRGRDHQCAWAADQQQRQAAIDPVSHGCENNSGGTGITATASSIMAGVVTAEPIEEAFDRRAALFGLFNQLQNAVDGVLPGSEITFICAA